MVIFIDNEYKCHTINEGTMKAAETDFFDGKCTGFIEGYRFVPYGSTWVRADGEVFTGEMITPFKDYNILRAYQEQYEAMLTEAAAAYESGVNSV